MLSVIAVAMAVGYSLYVWRHGEIFASTISWIGDHGLTGRLQQAVVWLKLTDTPGDGVDLMKSRAFRVATKTGEKLTYMLLCPICLTFWLSLIFSAMVCKLSLGVFGLLVHALASALGGYWAYRVLYVDNTSPRNQQ
jgi:hypothetical protein